MIQKIYRYHPGYVEARERVQAQSLEADLKLLDDLFGRNCLKYGAPPWAVKEEALRQLELEFRGEESTLATAMVALIREQSTRQPPLE